MNALGFVVVSFGDITPQEEQVSHQLSKSLATHVTYEFASNSNLY